MSGQFRVEKVVTSGTFALDGGEWEVDNNIWIVGDDTECMVIDAAHEAAPIVEGIAGRRVVAIVCTHGHNDHINAAADLADTVDAPIVIHPDDRARVIDGLYRALETLQEDWSDEYRFQRKDGAWAQVRTHAILVRDDGKVLNVIGSMVDVTAEKQAELDRLQADARNRLQASLLD